MGDTSVIKSDSPSAMETPPPPPMDSAAMMKAWMAYMTPGEPHNMLMAQNGKWSEESTMWMAPGAPPTKSKMSCVNTMIMGGRYQQSRHSGIMENMPFEGISTLGYDNAKKLFVSSWIDNMGTGISYTEGPWDEASKTITLKGKMTDPMGGKDIMVRQVLTMIDATHHKLEMYNTQAGQQEYKCMEITMTKQ
jgi:hypothetical protein